MNTKSKEAHFIASVLQRAGVAPWIVDLSMKPHDLPATDITGDQVARLAGTSWQSLDGYVRQEAAAVMVEGGIKLLHEKYMNGDIAGAIGIGGANGTNLVCSILRSLPYLVPKVMVSTVAGTAAVQWYVAESDIAMYPSIGDRRHRPRQFLGWSSTRPLQDTRVLPVQRTEPSYAHRYRRISNTGRGICKTAQFGQGAGPHPDSARRFQRAQQTPRVQSQWR